MIQRRQLYNATGLAYLDDGSGSLAINPNLTRYSLPNGLYIDGSAGLATSVTGDSSATVAFKRNDTLFWSIAMLKLTRTHENMGFPYVEPVTAVECGLSYCVKTLETTMTNNRLLEYSYENTNATRSPNSWTRSGSNSWTQIGSNTSSRECGLDLECSSLNTPWPRSDLVLGHNYNLSQAAIAGTISTLNDVFIYSPLLSLVSQKISPATGYCSDQSTVPCVPAASKIVYASTNLAELFHTLAASMTNAIRIGSDQGTVQQGQNGVLTTKYRIEWGWIALPVAVLLASFVQLFITIVHSRGRPLWKDSTLATMSRGRFVSEALDDFSTVAEMERAAAWHKVDLFDRSRFEKGET